MCRSYPRKPANMQTPNYGPDPTSPQTTFVQADPSNFRSIVQKLTGAPDDPSAPKLPVTLSSRATQKSHYPSGAVAAASASTSSAPTEIGPRRPPFKLHERRHRKLDQIQLSNPNRTISFLSSPHHAYYYPDMAAAHRLAPSPSSTSPAHLGGRRVCGGGEMPAMVSPVSPLDLFARMSPGSSHQSLLSPAEQEERAIAEKGFYLHPSPLSTPRAAEPELLPLFPLHSPRDDPDRRP